MNISPKITFSIKNYISISIHFLFALFVIRLFEFVLLYLSANYLTKTCCNYCLCGLGYDVVYFCKMHLILFPLFMVFSYFKEREALNTIKVLFVLLLTIKSCLVIYFSIAGVPLDKVIFSYSLSEIKEIISSSQSVPIWSYVAVILIIILFYFLSKKIFVSKKFAIIGLFLFLAFAFIPQPRLRSFSSIEKYYIAENKLVFFFKSVLNDKISFIALEKNTLNDKNTEQMQSLVKEFQKKFPNISFVGNEYPFLHKDNTNDVLSNFLNLQSKKPNIVIIICEGLAREFSGYNSILPSATPFLDSLSSHGLSWCNCLSTSQRTICALPSVIGALPFGKTGFMNYRENAPEFHSLYTILNENGYHTSFFYGGSLCFDDMCHFLKLNHVDNYLDISQYDTCSEKNSWGLYDHKMIQESIKTVNFDTTHAEIYLTLTTHVPFEYPNDEKYTKRYQDILKKNNIEKPNELVRKYASYLYLDENIKKLINSYRKNKDFENTIFIITGDHNFNAMREPIVCYNVPLIIWSPMIKVPIRFPSIVSHRDITPSLIAMMKQKYAISSPDKVSWINTGLDTVHFFRSKTFSPLMDVGRNICHCLYNDIFYQNGQTYKLKYDNDRLTLQKIDDTINFASFFEIYKHLDLYVMENDMLIKNKRNNKEELLYNIQTIKDAILFIKAKADLHPCEAYNKEDVFAFQGRQFPLELCRIKVNNNTLSYQINTSFDIYIPDDDKPYDCIQVVTEIQREGKQIYWASEAINGYWMDKEKYNSWYHFSSKNNIQKERYQFKEGDIICLYIWNPAQRDFYLSDFKLTIQKFSL